MTRRSKSQNHESNCVTNDFKGKQKAIYVFVVYFCVTV